METRLKLALVLVVGSFALSTVPAFADERSQCIERTLLPTVSALDGTVVLANGTVPPAMPPKLAALSDHLLKVAQENMTKAGDDFTPLGGGHSLVLGDDGNYVLNIGFLERSQKRFMGLVLLAVKEGSLKRIHAGILIGNKALLVVDDIRKMMTKYPVEMDGMFMLPLLKNTRDEIARQAKDVGKIDPNSSTFWTPGEIEDFHAALKNLGLDKLEGDYGLVKFTVTPNGPPLVEVKR